MEEMDIEDDTNIVQAQPIANGNSEKENTSFTGKIVQITNVSPGATLQQIATLFGYIGTVTDIRMYPSEENPMIKVKLCYIKFENTEQCGVAQHLTNTVFIDKPLLVVPLNQEEIPEESDCQNLIKSINAYANSAGTGFLPQYFPPDDANGIPGLPPPPIITSTTDPVEIEEIKRTIFVENIADDISSEQLMAFFSGIGEVKYLRYKKDLPRYCFIEFSNIESVPTSLQYNGVLFGGKCLNVEYSKGAIIKPESERIASGCNAGRKSVRDVVVRPSSKERDSNWDSTKPRVFTSRSRSRSKSKSRRSRSRERRKRSRTRSRSPRRRRSRSRSASRRRRRSRSRTRSPIRTSRRRSKSRSRSRSPRRKRSRSRSRDRRRKRKSHSKSPSRSPRRRKKKSKSRSASPHKKKSSRKSKSKSPDRSSSSKKKKKDKDKDKEKEKEKEKSKKDKDKKEKEKGAEDEEKLKNLLTKIYTFEEKEKKKSDD